MAVVEKLVRYLEMRSPQQLRPARPASGLDVSRVADPADEDANRIRALHTAIATPHHWSSLATSPERWRELLADPDRADWIARAEGEDIGWASLRLDDAEQGRFTRVGMRPDAHGHGYGGAFLSEIVREGWKLLIDINGVGSAGPIWLSTSSWDHPHALANYLARGFVVTRLELHQQQSGTDHRPTTRVAEPPQLLLRPAVAGDAAAVSSLIGDLGYDLPVEVARQRLHRFASSPDDIVAVVIDHPDDVVGFIAAHVIPAFAERYPGFVRITALSVAPSATRRGIGRRLVEFVEYIALSRGLPLLEVSSGQRPERAAAHRFYNDLGFEDSGSSSVRYWKNLDDEPTERS